MSKLVTTFSAHREGGSVYLRLNGTSFSLGILDAFDLAQLLTDLSRWRSATGAARTRMDRQLRNA